MRWPQGTQKGNQHNNLQFFVNVCMPHATCFMLFCYVLLDWDSSFTSSVRKPASKILGKESVGLNGSWVDSVNTKFENNMDPNDTNPVATASAAAFPLHLLLACSSSSWGDKIHIGGICISSDYHDSAWSVSCLPTESRSTSSAIHWRKNGGQSKEQWRLQKVKK